MTGFERDSTVFLLDDDDEARESLAAIIQSTGLKVQSHSSLERFQKEVDVQHPGCLILDFRLQTVSGLEVQKTLKGAGTLWPIIFLSGNADTRVAVEAMKLGAIDFFLKPVHEHILMDCIFQALALDSQNRVALRERTNFERRFALLTIGELEVLELVLQGWLNKQIAARLAISTRTVEKRRSMILKKLEVRFIEETIWHLGRNNIDLGNKPFSICDPSHPTNGPHFSPALSHSSKQRQKVSSAK